MKKWSIVFTTFLLMIGMIPSITEAKANQEENSSFRNLEVSEPFVEYIVNGKARTNEGTFHYRVKDGSRILITGWSIASVGGPEWGSFQVSIHLPKSKSALKTDLTLEMFEKSAKDGSEVNKLVLPLQEGNSTVTNGVFKEIQVSKPHVIYYVYGEAKVHNGLYKYAVHEGHDYLVEGIGVASAASPDWGVFNEKITIPLDEMPINGALIMELSKQKPTTGEWVYTHHILMDQTPWP